MDNKISQAFNRRKKAVFGKSGAQIGIGCTHSRDLKSTRFCSGPSWHSSRKRGRIADGFLDHSSAVNTEWNFSSVLGNNSTGAGQDDVLDRIPKMK